MASLPYGWAQLPLGDLCARATERVLPADAGTLPYIGLEHVERDSHRLKGHGNAGQTTSYKTVFRMGDVLYGRLRPNLNKVVVAPFDGICSTDILVLRPTSLLDARYLLLVLSTRHFLDYAERQAKGINLPRLSIEALLEYIAPIPPIAEQRRILDNLEVRAAALHAVEERLVSTTRLVDALPAKIMAAATRGLLTRTWRAHSSLAEAASETKAEFADGSGRLPKGWTSEQIDSVGSVRKGRDRLPKHHQGPNMRPYLRVANVLEGQIDLTDVMTMNFTPAEYERFRLKAGDILLNEGQSHNLVGRPAMVDDKLDGFCFTNSLIRFRTGELVLPDFALLVFRHYLHAGVFSRIAKITTNLAHLGAERFSTLPFPLPPLDEQHEIASIAGTLLDDVERIKRRMVSLSNALESLVVALRSDALAGRLADQDAADHPISVALADRQGFAAPQPPGPSQVRKKESPMKEILPVVEAMRAAAGTLSGQQLFAAAGYPEDAPSELVERFYLDLREQVAVGAIERREREGTDVFALTRDGSA